MPINVPADHVRYEEQRAQGRLELADGKCPKPGCFEKTGKETLRLTGSVVERGLILLTWDQEVGRIMLVKLTILVVLAECSECDGRFRILPCNVQAHKHHAIEVITLTLLLYAQGHRSLRAVVGELYFKSDDPDKPNDRQLDHSTVHGWLEGFGYHVLDRHRSRTHGESFSYFLAKAIAYDHARVRTAMVVAIHVDERRYRTEPRRERLAAVDMGLNVATTLANVNAADPASLGECRSLILSSARACTLGFASRILRTPFQHCSSESEEESRAIPITQTERTRDSCQTHTRSPPGDSKR